MSLCFNKKDSPCWPRQSKPSLKLLDCGRKIQNDVHIDTYIANQSSYHDDKSTLQCFTCVFCPQLIRNVRSRPHIDSSSIIAHPVNSDLHTWERSLKCYAKNSTYIYIYLYDALDNRYAFSTWDWLHHFSQFLFMKSLKKKMFFKF